MLQFNDPFTFVNNITLAAGNEVTYQVRADRDFYWYDLAGVPNAAAGLDLTLEIENLGQTLRYQNQPTRAMLMASMVPGGSTWYHPGFVAMGDVLQVRAVLRAGAAGVNFDMAILGYYHRGGVPPDCPQPVKELYSYSFDYGTINAGVTERQSISVVSGKDFVGMGWVGTTNASALNSITYQIENESTGRMWSSAAVAGFALFGNLVGNVRRVPERQPIRLFSDQSLAISATNTTGAPVQDVACAVYGFHVDKGEIV